MAEPLPPDPYEALGVAKDASSAAIKTAYRKAALKCHPDKAKGREDEFHRIKSAFDIIGDDDKRKEYDDTMVLERIRREQQHRRGSRPNVDIRNATYEFRSPPTPTYARGPTRPFDPRRQAPSFDEDYRFFDPEASSRASSRKYDGYDASSPKKASRSTKAPEDTRREPKAEKPSPKEREYQKKQRARNTERERTNKYNTTVEESRSDSDEGFYDSQPRRTPSDREPPRRQDSRPTEEYRYDRQTADAREYIVRSRDSAPVDMSPGAPPPLFSRSASYKEPEIGLRKSGKDGRPVIVKRSSARPAPKEKTPEPARKTSLGKDRRAKEQENTDHGAKEARRPPPLKTNFTMPSDSPPADSRRAKTGDVSYETREPRTPRLSRAETMPIRTSFRRDDTIPVTPSNLRTEVHDSGYSTSNSTSSTPPPQTSSKTYKYPDNTTADFTAEPSSPYFSEFRAPSYDRTRQRSPEETIRGHATSTRRPPQPARSNSFQNETPPKKSTSTRRPSVTRTTGSFRGIPNLSRGASMPLPKSGRTGAHDNSTEDLLFGELPRSRSPVEIPGLRPQSPADDFDPQAYRSGGFSREFLRRSSAGLDAFGNVPGLAGGSGRGGMQRRSSEDHQMRSAHAHMDKVEFEYRSPQRRQATAY